MRINGYMELLRDAYPCSPAFSILVDTITLCSKCSVNIVTVETCYVSLTQKNVWINNIWYIAYDNANVLYIIMLDMWWSCIVPFYHIVCNNHVKVSKTESLKNQDDVFFSGKTI